MTLLVAWSGVDSRGPASIYITADSRISWSKSHVFDYGRKVFALKRYPDIVGYCGDILFPSMALSQIVELADNGLLFTSAMSCKERFEAVKEKLVQQFTSYPKNLVAEGMFHVVYAARDLSNHRSFFCHVIQWHKVSGWSGREIPVTGPSSVLLSLGSGGKPFRERLKIYNQGPNKSTSRAVFHCFCNTLFTDAGFGCGGAPQLVGVYRKIDLPAKQFGIVRAKKRYLYGAEVDRLPFYGGVDWRNDLFERVDGETMQLLKGAKSQPDPLRTS
jgi:hypothetical protein